MTPEERLRFLMAQPRVEHTMTVLNVPGPDRADGGIPGVVEYSTWAVDADGARELLERREEPFVSHPAGRGSRGDGGPDRGYGPASSWSIEKESPHG